MRNSPADRLAALSPGQQQALQSLLRERSEWKTIRPRAASEAVPLTFGQQRLWLLEQLVPESVAYNESVYLNFPYAVDAAAVREAINQVIQRHEILRTVFTIDQQGDPVQTVLPSLHLAVPVLDLRQHPAPSRQGEALALAAENARRRFSLSTGPLLRASLYRLEESSFVLAVTMHHLICDGWSIGIFAAEFFTLYWSHVLGRPSPLTPLELQYGDFAAWQRRAFTPRQLAPELAYWRDQLAGLSTVDLSADHPRPPVFTHRGAHWPLRIDGPLYDALLRLAEHEGVSLNTVLLAAFFALLHRYSGAEDLTVGLPIAGRSRSELQPLIGFFVNTLVLRADLSGTPSARDLIARVAAVSRAAISHETLPFERLVDELHPRRDPSRNPLFQVTFQFFQAPVAPGLSREVVLPFRGLDIGIAKFDLSFELQWTNPGIIGHVEYCTDLFDAARIERMAAHYLRLVETMVANPGRPVATLDLLTAEEHRQQVSWNQTKSGYPSEASVADVFSAQVRATPTATAVRFGGSTRSYAEVGRRAEALALELLDKGVLPGEPVAVFLNRCLELPEAMLGVLMAGAAYVPLTPGLPSERLAWLVADSGARILVTSAERRVEAPAFTGPIVEVGGNEAEKAPASALAETGPDSPAYLMYTSGTTGRPKGVLVTHRNILRLVKGVRYARFEPGGTMLQLSPFAFDASTFEIWGALLNGMTLAIYPPGPPSLEELGSFCSEQKIDLAFLTTGLFREAIETIPAAFRSIKHIITGGEAMPPSLAQLAWRLLPRTRLTNAYGPTECGAFASTFAITGADAVRDEVPIGLPLENSTFYILDSNLQPVPVGIPGELYIGGDGVATGYWKRPELTGAAFLPDSFRGRGRMYRTGDIVVRREDGNVVFIGRRDRQIKLSGYRIELEEIEAALLACPGVSAGAVLVQGDSNERRLIAFAVGSNAAAIKEFVASRLPRYMLPAAVHVVDRLPLTPNGKTDLAALAGTLSDSPAAPTVTRESTPPSTEVEKELALLWHEVLNVDNCGIHDSFFDLGGQSLIATRLLSRIRRAFDSELTMRQFFDHPTIYGLASLIDRERETRPTKETVHHGSR